MDVASALDIDCVYRHGDIDCDWMVSKAMIGPTNPTEYSDALKSLMESARLLPKPTYPEVVLILRTHFEELMKSFDNVGPGMIIDRIRGIPIEVFDTEYEQEMRALELAESGKRCLICK